MGWKSNGVLSGLVSVALGLTIVVAFVRHLGDAAQGTADADERRLQMHLNPAGQDTASTGGGIASVYGGSPSSPSPAQGGSAYNPYGVGNEGAGPYGPNPADPYALYRYIGESCGYGVSLLIFFCYACLYKNWVVDELPEYGGFSRAEFPKLGDCCRIPDWSRCLGTCLWSWCCFPVINAKNYAATDTCAYWPSLCLIWGCYSAGWFPGACMKTYLSMKLKDNMNLETSCCQEFAVALCCVWCETAREGMMVDEELGVKIDCPFEVEVETGAETFVKDVREVFGLENNKVDALERDHGDNKVHRRNCTIGDCSVM